MKHSSRQFGAYFSGFGRRSKKCSRIGACIRRNFTPCTAQLILSLSYLIAWTQDIGFPITQEKLKVTFRVGFKLLELCTTAALSSLSPMGQKH